MKRLAVLLALVLAACASTDADRDVAAGDPVDDRGEQQAALDDLTIDGIDARQTAWEASTPDAYRYIIDSTCGCDWGGTFEVTVVSGAVVTVRSLDSDPEKYRRYFAQTIEEMFAMFREALTVGAEENTGGRVTAEFDEDLGHPVAFMVQWTHTDQPYEAQVSGFAPIDASEVAAPDETTIPLVISNQSFERPDARISVTIDGETVADGVFSVGNQHTNTNYDVPLEPGGHEVLATSDAGARLATTIEVVADEPLFLVLTYWTGEEPGEEPAFFDFTASSEPPGFG